VGHGCIGDGGGTSEYHQNAEVTAMSRQLVSRGLISLAVFVATFGAAYAQGRAGSAGRP